MTLYIKQPVSCNDCGFTTTDVPLFNNHSCDVQNFGGRCEDYPCCGHEMGDCNGQLYGSDEAIKARAMEHIGCDHEAGIYECWDEEEEDEEPEVDDDFPMSMEYDDPYGEY